MQNFESGHGLALHRWSDLRKLVHNTPRKAVVVRQYMGGALAGEHEQPLPPNSLLGRVHFGFSQGRPGPCNFYNAPHNLLCTELQLCNLLHHSIGRLRPGYSMPPTLYHPRMMLRSAIFMLC